MTLACSCKFRATTYLSHFQNVSHRIQCFPHMKAAEVRCKAGGLWWPLFLSLTPLIMFVSTHEAMSKSCWRQGLQPVRIANLVTSSAFQKRLVNLWTIFVKAPQTTSGRLPSVTIATEQPIPRDSPVSSLLHPAFQCSHSPTGIRTREARHLHQIGRDQSQSDTYDALVARSLKSSAHRSLASDVEISMFCARWRERLGEKGNCWCKPEKIR